MPLGSSNSDDSTGAPPTPGVQRYVATLLEGVKYRGELMSLEWQEEKRRLFQVVLSAVLAALSTAIALASLNVVLLMIFWETHRLEVAVGFSVLYALLALIFGLSARRRARLKDKPFQSTFEELRKDGERILSGK